MRVTNKGGPVQVVGKWQHLTNVGVNQICAGIEVLISIEILLNMCWFLVSLSAHPIKKIFDK